MSMTQMNLVQVVDNGCQKSDRWDGGCVSECVPLTPEQAQLVRSQLNASAHLVSPKRVLTVQALVGCVVALAAWAFTQDLQVLQSALWGAASIVLPGAVFLRAYVKSLTAPNAAVAMLSLFCWELVKIGLTTLMLVMAVFLISVNWVALLLGFVLTMKAYWLALLLGRSSKTLIR